MDTNTSQLETGFIIPSVSSLLVFGLIFVAVIMVGAFYARKYKKLGAYFVALIALGMWLLSAGMNMNTGWTTGAVFGIGGALFGATFLLFTEFIVPVALIYKNITGLKLPVIVLSSIALGLALSVFSFWNGTSMALNGHFAKMVFARGEAEALQTDIEANKTSESGMSISLNSL